MQLILVSEHRNQLLDIGIRCLSRPGVHHLQGSPHIPGPGIIRHPPAIEHQDHPAPQIALVTRQDPDQFLSGIMQRQCLQTAPAVDDVVAIHHIAHRFGRMQRDILLFHCHVPPLVRLHGFLLVFVPPGHRREGLPGFFLRHHGIPVPCRGVSCIPHGFQRNVHMVRCLIPGNGEPGSAGTEHAVRCVAQIRHRIIVNFRQDPLLVGTRFIPGLSQFQHSPAFGQGAEFVLEIRQVPQGTAPGDAVILDLHGSTPLLQLIEDSADELAVTLNGKGDHGLQQHRFSRFPGGHERLPDRAVRRLTEVAAFGVLQVTLSGCDSDLHIRQVAPRQYPFVALVAQSRQDLCLEPW